MTYFCYVECSLTSVPYMEPLFADDPVEALAEAAAILRQHSSGYAAVITNGERQVARLQIDRYDEATV